MDNNKLRNEIINQGIDRGFKATEINNVLRKQGLREYNPLTTAKNYMELLPNLGKGATQIARDLGTFGGAVIKPISDIVYTPHGYRMEKAKQAFREAVNNPTMKNAVKGAVAGGAIGSRIPSIGGILGGALLGGTIGALGLKDFSNAMASTYDTDLNTLGKVKRGEYKLGDLAKDIAQGALRNPAYVALDVAPVVAKPVSKSVGKIVNSVPENAPMVVQQILPSKQVRNFNRGLTESIVSSKAKASDMYRGYISLDEVPNINREELVRHLTTNKSNLTGKELKVANNIKKNLIDNEKELIKIGVMDADSAKADTVAQYVMQHIAKDSNLLHKDIVDIINIRGLDKEAKPLIDDALGKRINKLIDEGEALYDDNKIAYLSQKFAVSKDPLGLRYSIDYNTNPKEYFDTARIIGRTDAKRLSNVLDKTIKFQLDQVAKSREGLDVLNDIMNNPKVFNSITKEGDFKSQSLFRKSLVEDIQKGEVPDLSKALKKSGISNNIDKIYYTSLNNAFKTPANTGWRRWLNAFKKAVLANPHWVALNRLGNWSNNAMEGVTHIDYMDTKKYKHLIPDALKQQTAFNSYINAGVDEIGTTAKSSIGQPINRIKESIGSFKESDKSMSDIARLFGDLYSSSSDITANPLFRAEAGLELADRYANFIRQAKREAEATNKTVEAVLKEANKDRALFNKLNTQVNKSLGDYLGRNYALPTGLYNFTSEVIPFYRFLTQTGRTTAHQLANRPLAFLTNVDIPTKVGNQLSNQIIQEYGLDQEKYKGGIPYAIGADGNIRTLSLEPIPIGSLANTFGSWDNLLGTFSPMVSTLHDALFFERFGRPATSPRMAGMSKKEIENFKPTVGERLGYGLNTLLNTTYNPAIWANRLGPEIAETIAEETVNTPLANVMSKAGFGTGLQSRYDTNPFLQNPYTYNRQTPLELIGRWIGAQTNSNYPANNRKSKSALRRERISKMYKEKKRQDLKKDKRRI